MSKPLKICLSALGLLFCSLGLFYFSQSSTNASDACAIIESVRINQDQEGNSSLRPNQPFICTVVTDELYFGSPTVACGIAFDNEPPNTDYCINDSDIPVSWTTSDDTAIASFNCVVPEGQYPENTSTIEVVGLDTNSACSDSQDTTSVDFRNDPVTVPDGAAGIDTDSISDSLIRDIVKNLLETFTGETDPLLPDAGGGGSTDTESNNSNTGSSNNNRSDEQQAVDISGDENVQLVGDLINEIKRVCNGVVNASNYGCVRNISIPGANQDYLRLSKNEIVHSATSYSNCGGCQTVFQCVGFVQAAYYLTHGSIPPRRQAAINYTESPSFKRVQKDSSGRVTNNTDFAPGSFCTFDYGNPWGHIAYLLDPNTLLIAEANYNVSQGGGDVNTRELLSNGSLTDAGFLGCAEYK
jgi:hypothetical protein